MALMESVQGRNDKKMLPCDAHSYKELNRLSYKLKYKHLEQVECSQNLLAEGNSTLAGTVYKFDDLSKKRYNTDQDKTLRFP